MRDAIGHLLDDHREIMAEVEDLRRAIEDLRRRGDAALGEARPVLERVGQLMATTLLRHARKEDEALFPALEAIFGTSGTPTAVMRAEHRAIHDRAELFRTTLRQLEEIEHPKIVAGGARLRGLTAGASGAISWPAGRPGRRYPPGRNASMAWPVPCRQSLRHIDAARRYLPAEDYEDLYYYFDRTLLTARLHEAAAVEALPGPERSREAAHEAAPGLAEERRLRIAGAGRAEAQVHGGALAGGGERADDRRDQARGVHEHRARHAHATARAVQLAVVAEAPR